MKGIMFKENLFNSILSGDKTQTRRVVFKGKYGGYNPINMVMGKPQKCQDGSYLIANGTFTQKIFPRYKVGELIYLKEPYFPKGNTIQYAFDYATFLTARKITKWKNKMFMPASAARYYVKVTEYRMERLQDITRSDIRREGLIVPEHLRSDDIEYNYRQWLPDEWKRLWDSINKPPFDWFKNPWVWVYEFELTTRDGVNVKTKLQTA